MVYVNPTSEESPNLPEVHALLALFNQARYLEAATQAEEMTKCFPRHPFGWKIWGAALNRSGRNAEALALMQKAITLSPADAELYNNIGIMLNDVGRLKEAADYSRRALMIQPDYAEAHNNLGVALNALGQFDEAIASYRRALKLKPELACVYSNLGAPLNALRRFDEAVASCRRALELQPDLVEAHNHLGGALKDLGLIAEAVVTWRRGLEFKPGYADVHSNLIFALLYRWGGDAEVMAAALRRWNEQHAMPLAPFISPHANDRSPDRRLRIGYVSHDFVRHPVAYFLIPLLEAHDRERFHISCYTTNPKTDEVTHRLRGCVDVWRNLAGMTDEAIARQIREDGIDVLIDLSGHTGGNLLLVFARKPAPVQVSYLGFPCETGLGTIDYRLTDRWADPAGGAEEEAAEQPVRLPETAWCFSPLSGEPPVGDLPATCCTHVTFGCFNNFTKVTEEMLHLWTRILQRMPGSRLVLKNTAVSAASVAQRVLGFFARQGISADRLKLLSHTRSPLEHLHCYHEVDLALDTFPYHGTTTTCEALWMGVPVITLAGSRHVARVGVSLLSNLGLPELVTHNAEEYVEKSVALASDLPRLTALRAGLRERMRRSPLMDAPRFARNIEAAYRTMWRRWCVEPEAEPVRP